MSLLGHVHAVVLNFEIKIFFFPSLRTPQGRPFLKCLGARSKGEEVDNSSSYLYLYVERFLDTNKY